MSMHGKLHATELALPGVFLITPERFEDVRGSFTELFNPESFASIGITTLFIQDSIAFSRKGVIRGLHYQQEPHAQAKLVRCAAGSVYDVAADVDPSSPTYGHFVSCVLSGETQQMLYIPEGYAHGVCALEDSLVEYKLSGSFVATAAQGAPYDDPLFSIPWPIEHPILSAADQHWEPLPRI